MATFTVTTANDENNGTGPLSLREAVAQSCAAVNDTDGTAEFQIRLDGPVSITVEDFYL